MVGPELTSRQRYILKAIVDDYVATAEPVGSRTISRRYIPNASPATIRNDMADLEELGYIEQPHTSAGRVPTDRGYRYYVDRMLEETPVPEPQSLIIERVLGAKMRQVEALVQATVHVLSDTSRLISIMLGPQFEPASLVRIEVVSVAEGRAVLALVSDAGFVEARLVELKPSLGPGDLKHMTELINGLLQGRSWEELSRPGVLRGLRRELGGYESVLDDTIEFLKSSLQPGASQRVYVSGAARLLDLPEFQDIERTKTVLGLLDHETAVLSLLTERLASQGVSVTIGRENGLAEMADCSLVSAPYRMGGRAVGAVAVLGPKRMDYGLIFSLVDMVASSLDELMDRLA
ncbi:MAG: heat-inducible transcription repressor HrcA [Bacillota bacterium]|nr:MAG: heat-inducible transcription repressor HrcA [Bacillota bacterium]